MKRVRPYFFVYFFGSIAIVGGLFVSARSGAFQYAFLGTQTSDQTDTQTPVTLLFLGDTMMDRGVERSVTDNFAGDYDALFATTSYIAKADIAFANLEGPVGTTGRNVGSKYSFRMDPEVVPALQRAGIDIVSFANNHVGDYTREAFDETLIHLNENGIAYAGAGNTYADARTPRIVSVRGMRIGYLAMTDVGPTWLAATAAESGTLLASDPDLALIIAEAKKEVDVLVVSFHWGDEYSPANKRQVTLAHKAIDSGADIIVGHHPHVMQRVETYREKLIFYSLGNFIFDQYFSPHTMRGMVATVSIDPHTKGLTTSLAVSPLGPQFVPGALIPFTESLLVTEPFTP